VLAAFQDTLVRLCSHRDARARFLADRAGFLAPLALDDRERNALMTLSAPRLNRYAESLLAKRAGELVRAAPHAARVARSLPRRYRTWLKTNPAPLAAAALSAGVAEGLRALPALYPALAKSDVEACYAADLLAYELFAQASREDGQLRVHVARYAVHALLPDLERGYMPIDPELCRVRYCFRPTGVEGAHG
jgi:hypothetical protein